MTKERLREIRMHTVTMADCTEKRMLEDLLERLEYAETQRIRTQRQLDQLAGQHLDPNDYHY